ncbi:WbqC family protein [Candidatus Omnitrophota bacterium]
MKIAIHQPQYMPWLGYFDKMDQVDVFVLLDDVQYKKNEWQNRNKIRTATDWQWLTVPVLSNFGQTIKEVKINDLEPWRQKHIKSIEMNYSRADYFEEYFQSFKSIIMPDWEYLERLSICLIIHLKDILSIKTELVRSSSFHLDQTKTERLVEICRMLNADTYLSGPGAKEYLDEKLFEQNGITLEYQEFKHPEYKQVFNGFEPYMSALDLVFCHGAGGLDIIREGRGK